jgi:hypothetical protein
VNQPCLQRASICAIVHVSSPNISVTYMHTHRSAPGTSLARKPQDSGREARFPTSKKEEVLDDIICYGSKPSDECFVHDSMSRSIVGVRMGSSRYGAIASASVKTEQRNICRALCVPCISIPQGPSTGAFVVAYKKQQPYVCCFDVSAVAGGTSDCRDDWPAEPAVPEICTSTNGTFQKCDIPPAAPATTPATPGQFCECQKGYIYNASSGCLGNYKQHSEDSLVSAEPIQLFGLASCRLCAFVITISLTTLFFSFADACVQNPCINGTDLMNTTCTQRDKPSKEYPAGRRCHCNTKNFKYVDETIGCIGTQEDQLRRRAGRQAGKWHVLFWP